MWNFLPFRLFCERYPRMLAKVCFQLFPIGSIDTKKRCLYLLIQKGAYFCLYKLGIWLGCAYSNSKLRLNLCLSWAYTNLNLKYDFKDSYLQNTFSDISRVFLGRPVHTLNQRGRHCGWRRADKFSKFLPKRLSLAVGS